jgi:hypothetical protein
VLGYLVDSTLPAAGNPCVSRCQEPTGAVCITRLAFGNLRRYESSLRCVSWRGRAKEVDHQPSTTNHQPCRLAIRLTLRRYKHFARVERLEFFDEYEEWRLLQAHYCVCWAVQDTKLVRENQAVEALTTTSAMTSDPTPCTNNNNSSTSVSSTAAELVLNKWHRAYWLPA